MYNYIARKTAERMGEMLDDNHPVFEGRDYIDLHTIYPDEILESETYKIDKFE